MFSMLLPLLKSKLAKLGAVIVVAIVIAIIGSRFFPRYRLWFYLAALLIIAGYLIYLGISKWRAKKNARMLEGFLNQQADDQLLGAQPDVQDELEAIKKKLNAALQILKKSRIAKGRRGAEALYVLPWYMIIGPSASGKSTAIRNSGLHFPPVDPESEDPGKIKGLGGTRNCDWWFSNEGIIIDTAGRYTLSQNVQEDREEWQSFLEMLRRSRPRAPINGLILAISIDELLQKDADGLEAHARALRSRVDELILRLRIHFPIYVVFTKCDLISGFVESFGDLSRVDREQVWGFTRRGVPVDDKFAAEFDAELESLREVLERRRITQLATEMRPGQRRGKYLFPVELAAARTQLTHFVETLFRPNPYQLNPIVRGVYFTSGTQEGTPIAQVIASVNREFGLPPQQSIDVESSQEAKAYFIRDLFQEVILPDESMVYPTTQAWRRRRWLRAAAMAGQVIATGLLILMLVISYGNNRRANGRLAQIAAEVAQATRGGGYGFQWELLDSLDYLRTKLEAAEGGAPLMRRWGLHSGDVVADAARRLYFRRFHDLLLVPTGNYLEQQLALSFSCDDQNVYDQQYASFSAYRMITLPPDSTGKSSTKLRDQVLLAWQPAIQSEESQSRFQFLAEDQVAYYWKHRADTAITWLTVRRNHVVEEHAQEQLNNCMNPRVLYRTMMEEINDELGDFDYRNAVSSNRIYGGSISRAYTRDGWQNSVKPRIQNMPTEISQDPLKQQTLASYSPDDIRSQLTNFYVQDFKEKWRDFIASGTVYDYNDLTDASLVIGELAQDPSPLVKVLDRVFDDTDIRDANNEPFRAIEDEFRQLGRFLGRLDSAPGDVSGASGYSTELKGVAEAAGTAAEKLSGEARCARSLMSMNTTLSRSEAALRRSLSGTGISGAAIHLLMEPMRKAEIAATSATCDCLDRNWRTVVFDEFSGGIGQSYPFNKMSTTDVSMAQVSDFFVAKIGAFIDNEIRPATEARVAVSAAFRRAMDLGGEMAAKMKRGSDKLVISLRADARNMSGPVEYIQLRYGTGEWRYSMGPASAGNFDWPPPGGNATAELRASATGGVYYRTVDGKGEWGILRLLDNARHEPGSSLLTWKVEPISGDGPPISIRLNLEGTDAAFLLNGHFTQFVCPESVCR